MRQECHTCMEDGTIRSMFGDGSTKSTAVTLRLPPLASPSTKTVLYVDEVCLGIPRFL